MTDEKILVKYISYTEEKDTKMITSVKNTFKHCISKEIKI